MSLPRVRGLSQRQPDRLPRHHRHPLMDATPVTTVPADDAGSTSVRPAVVDAIRPRTVTPATPAWLCVGSAVALSLLGLYAIDLALRWNGPGSAGAGADSQPFIAPRALRQGAYLLIGLGAGAMVAWPQHRWLVRSAWGILAVSLALLTVLLLPGVPEWLVRPRNGTRAWISLGVVEFQPSELAKIAFVLAVGRYLRFRRTHRRLAGLLPVALIAAGPVGLITLQPDLGSAVLFIPVLFAMLLAAGARVRHLALIVLAATLAAPAMFPLLKPHQQARIVALYHQLRGDRSGASDISFQSFTAQALISCGGLAGNSDAHTRALVHFNRLPERHNDMIFAVIVARWGLWGALGVLALVLAWTAGALATAACARDPCARLVCVGLGAFVFVQAAVNLGMNVGLLPIIGVTLPFVSYGGSSLIASWVMTGIVVGIGVRPPVPPFRPAFEYDDEDS